MRPGTWTAVCCHALVLATVAPAAARTDSQQEALKQRIGELSKVIRSGGKLAPFLAGAGVLLGYSTSNRDEGSTYGQRPRVEPRAVDASVAIRCTVDGQGWASSRKRKPRLKVIKLDVRRQLKEILRLLDEYNKDSSGPQLPEVDLKKATYTVSYLQTWVKFQFRHDKSGWVVSAIEYVSEDPG